MPFKPEPRWKRELREQPACEVSYCKETASYSVVEDDAILYDYTSGYAEARTIAEIINHHRRYDWGFVEARLQELDYESEL